MYLNIGNKERNERIGTLHNITHILEQKLPSSFFSEKRRKEKGDLAASFIFFISQFLFDFFPSTILILLSLCFLAQFHSMKSLSLSLSLSHTQTHTHKL